MLIVTQKFYFLRHLNNNLTKMFYSNDQMVIYICSYYQCLITLATFKTMYQYYLAFSEIPMLPFQKLYDYQCFSSIYLHFKNDKYLYYHQVNLKRNFDFRFNTISKLSQFNLSYMEFCFKQNLNKSLMLLAITSIKSKCKIFKLFSQNSKL